MRGKVCTVRCGFLGVGITPAYAGKSTIFQIKTDIHRDHPRLCGEKFSNCDEKTTCGITPAYAGKSFNFCQNRCICQDHPRLCGEKHGCYMITKLQAGSPPPMRGKVTGTPKSPPDLRITPAYAGKSHLLLQRFPRTGDHPRLCGEKTKKILKQRYFFHQPASFSFSLQYT